jgi:hypothetical protein
MVIALHSVQASILRFYGRAASRRTSVEAYFGDGFDGHGDGGNGGHWQMGLR